MGTNEVKKKFQEFFKATSQAPEAYQKFLETCPELQCYGQFIQ